MYRAREPDDGRCACHERIDLALGEPARVGDLVEVGADGVEARDVLRRRDEVDAHGAPLVGDADLLDAHAILGGLGDPEEDPLLEMVLRVPGADGVAEDRFGAGDAGAIRAAVEGEVPVVAERIDGDAALGRECGERGGEERGEGGEGHERGRETTHVGLRGVMGHGGPGDD